MKIANVTIDNFRSIEHASLTLSDFNTLIGQNNTGKTNLFEAINWFYTGSGSTGDIKFQRDPNREIIVSVEFSGAQHGAENMVNEANRTKILNILSGADSITITRQSSDPKKRTVTVNGEVKKNPTGFDTALNDFLPKFEYIHTRQYYEEFTKYNQKSAVGIMLSSVIEEILSDDPKYRAFRSTFEDLFNSEDSAVNGHFKALGGSVKNHLEKQFSECTKVFFEVQSPEFNDLLKKFETVVDDGIETYASEKGDGMQRALMLAIIQAYADYRKAREDAGKSFLFFIDEAELHLHPTAQRKLKNVLLELSKSLDQVVISTHSSVFVADSSENESVFKTEKNDCRTDIFKTEDTDKPYIIYELLGGSPADLLLPRNFLIVEGPSEFELLTRVIKRHYNEKPPIQIISAEGDTHQAKRSINAIVKAYSPMGHSIYSERTIILCDQPTEKAKPGFDQFIGNHEILHKRGQILVLPFGSLEECYPDENEWRRSEDATKGMTGHQKKQLAKTVGDNITKEAFEQHMPALKEALSRSWANAF
ncbi:ATP-dependent endonuclease [Pseudomonas sp. 2(2015)]|uniref:ATP-dependent nuclease n=1 Tax=Pseudomonas sp. 2(2015) TaxID=1619950 RepID=UPI0005EBE74E|nr:AAA family ATPase [Pseudomonas sp. 2(2015)]KJK17151.1 chromosome segregation protein SMC [Pseudomonas sp. 2(2015)]